MTTSADLMDLQQRLQDRYDSGSWGSGFPDDPSGFGRAFQNFSDVPNPDDFGTFTDNLLGTLEKLAPSGFDTGQSEEDGSPGTGTANTALDGVAAAGVEVDDWTGRAADGFFTWSMSWKTGISNQFAAAHVLRQLLHAEAAIWTAALDDLKNLGEAALEALEAADDQFDTGAGDFKTALKVVGAIVAVAGVVPTGGASLSILAAVGAGVTVASTGMDLYEEGAKEDATIRSCCPREVLNDLQEAVSKVEREVRTAEELIKEQVQNNLDEITRNWSEFCHEPPDLASTPRRDIHGYDGLGTWG